MTKIVLPQQYILYCVFVHYLIDCFRTIASNVLSRQRDADRKPKQVLLYLGGRGGCGKTQVIQAITHLHTLLGIREKMRLTAYTGTAAAAIGGNTTSSVTQTYLTKDKAPDVKKLEATWSNIETLVVDEVSMIPCDMMKQMSASLVKAKHDDEELPFAGIDVVFAGENLFIALYYHTNPIYRTPI